MGLSDSPKLLKGVNKIPTKKNHRRIDSNLSQTKSKYVTLQPSDSKTSPKNENLVSNIKITSSRPNSKGSRIVLDIFNQFNGT